MRAKLPSLFVDAAPALLRFYAKRLGQVKKAEHKAFESCGIELQNKAAAGESCALGCFTTKVQAMGCPEIKNSGLEQCDRAKKGND